MNLPKLTIKETSHKDSENIKMLWNNGEVTKFAGFPDGIGVTMERLEKWIHWATSKPSRCHYSIYDNDQIYCGETFFNLDEKGNASLDIKLLPSARGKGIAQYALSYSIEQAFTIGGANRVYVDPHPQNEDAWKLYKKLNFKSKPRPEYLGDGESYLELIKSK